MKLSERQKNIFRFLGLRISSFAINVLLKSAKIKIQNREAVEELIASKKNFVVAFWHCSMMLGWFLHRNMNCAALVSKSKDGDVLAHVLKKWKYTVVRGSSHSGGKEALDIMCNLAKQNFSLTITPDGPTGPIHKMKAGAVVTAKKSKIPLLLLGIGIKNKFVLKSWDRFEVPKPFTKITALYSEPMYFDENLSYDDTSRMIEQCEKLLNKLQKDALQQC